MGILREELSGGAGEQGIDSHIQPDGPSGLPEGNIGHLEREGDHVPGELDASPQQPPLVDQGVQVFVALEWEDDLRPPPSSDGGDGDPSIEGGPVLPVDGEEPGVQVGMDVGEVGMTDGRLIDLPLQLPRLSEFPLGDQVTKGPHPPLLEIPGPSNYGRGLFPTGLNHSGREPGLGGDLIGDGLRNQQGNPLHLPEDVDDDLTDPMVLVDESLEVIPLPPVGEPEGAPGG